MAPAGEINAGYSYHGTAEARSSTLLANRSSYTT